MSVDLRSSLANLDRTKARWSGFEQLTGWAILSLPFSSGEVLGLRVFPFSDFAPYRSVWHRNVAGEWTVHVDGPALEIACPRWWGPALCGASLANIRVDWRGPRELRVMVDEPVLDWVVSFSERRMETLMNAMSAPMPTWSWRPRALRAPREWMARWALDMGRIKLDGRAPAGMEAVFMPGRIYGINSSHATLSGNDLGEATTAATEPTVGTFPFPVRGVLAIGDFRARIRDEQEYEALTRRYGRSEPAARNRPAAA